MGKQQYNVHGIMAQILAERVIQKLLERQKRALVVCTGSDMGLEAGLESLRMLRLQEGFSYRVILSRSAAEILDTQAVRLALEPEEFWIGKPPEPPEILTARYDTVLVPAMTVNTAAHVAACMADTPAAAIILDSLMRGKNVVVAVDGCCPDNPGRIQGGFRMTPALREKLLKNKETLRDYGAVLTTSDQLGKAALKAVTDFMTVQAPARPEPDAAGRMETKSPGAFSQRTVSGKFRAALEGRVFGAKHIKSYPDGAVIVVPGRTIVTQLALDEARRRHICIETEAD